MRSRPGAVSVSLLSGLVNARHASAGRRRGARRAEHNSAQTCGKDNRLHHPRISPIVRMALTQAVPDAVGDARELRRLADFE